MIPKPDLISMGRIEPFLPHQGARLGKLNDPPGPSFCVEGGVYREVTFQGAVFTPSSPAAGATRIDVLIANPVSGDLELIEGEEGGGVPSLDSFPTAGKVAQITLVGNSNQAVLVGADEIKDLRSVVLRALDESQTYRMLAQARIWLGGSVPTVGQKFGGGKLVVLAAKTWKPVKSYPNNAITRKTATQISYVDLKFLGTVSEFHVNLLPYNSILACVTENQEDFATSMGTTWSELTPDADGFPKFRVWAGAAVSPEDQSPANAERVTSCQVNGKFTATDKAHVQLQAWGRA